MRNSSVASYCSVPDAAAAEVGCSVGEIAKSLVFRAGERAVVAIMSGDHRLDSAKLASALGEEVSRADADFVLEVASKSTWREDLGPKRDIYARPGVKEYFTPVLQGHRHIHGQPPRVERGESVGEEEPARTHQHRHAEPHREPPEQLLEARTSMM